MIYAVIGVLAAIVIAWFVAPEFRAFLDGLKTRALAFLIMAAGGIGAVDPTLLSTALALDARGQAWALLIIGGLVWIARELTKKPGKLVKDARK